MITWMLDECAPVAKLCTQDFLCPECTTYLYIMASVQVVTVLD